MHICMLLLVGTREGYMHICRLALGQYQRRLHAHLHALPLVSTREGCMHMSAACNQLVK